MAALAWVAPLLLPLLAAGLALASSRGRGWLPAIAPLPALLLALAGPPSPPPDLSWILLDLRLGLDPTGRMLLAATATVWLLGGVAARRLAAERSSAAALWLTALAGNVGLVMAADAVTLYVLYATMTFAAYGLVVHDRTTEARRAGRIYVVLAVAGEAMLISGLVLAVGRAGATGLATITTALGAGDGTGVTVGLLAAGFAVKAGIVPLHLWLPLAHPVAPTPASAVLSGAMIKAGLVGWVRLLPLGAPSADGWGTTLVVAGLVTAFAGAALGVAQSRPKVVLAYSSVSQMGLVAVIVGVGLVEPAAAPIAVAAAVTHALHHGLAKAALFLTVGVRTTWHSTWGGRLVLAGAGLAGLALVGVPLTSGSLAKSAMKQAMGRLADPWAGRLSLALSLAAVGTTVLMIRFLVLLRRPAAAPDASARGAIRIADRALVAGWGMLLVAVVGLTWALAPRFVGVDPARALTVSHVVDGIWPLLAGAALAASTAAAVARLRRDILRRDLVAAGDLVVVGEALAPIAARAARRLATATGQAGDRVRRGAGGLRHALRPRGGFAIFDRAATRWRSAGVLLVLLVLTLTLALMRGAA